MYKGGTSYTPHAAKLIRYAGLIVPIVLVLYGYAIELGFVDGRHINAYGLLSLSIWWIYIGTIQFFSTSKSARDSALRLVSFHLLAIAYLLFVSGISTPIIAFWILLIVASNLYFSRKGVYLSILAFFITVGVDIIMQYHINGTFTSDAVALITILLSGLVVLSISRSQQDDKGELSQSKRQASFQRDRILTIVNNLADAILSTNKQGVITMYNAASLNLLDTNENLEGKNIDELLKLVDQDDKKVSLFGEFVKTRTAVTRDDLNYSFSDGEEIRLEITYSPIRSSYSRTKHAETHDGYIIIMRDVTKAKSLEEERDEFISVVSHELRTPITIMEGTLSNLEIMMNHPDITHKMMTDSVTMAHDQIVYLAKMVNDLSTLSRAERGVADNPEVINVRDMVHKMHEEYHKQAADRSLRFDLDLGAKVGDIMTSRLYIEELLQNLITNAIKYTKEGSVTLSVKQKLETITFTVKDTGIGISKSDQGKIFHKFYRSEDYRTRETSGTGLGLYVAAKLAHKVGTKIKLISRLNHGSTFSFTMHAHTDKQSAKK
jgi:PAS domain S-box-containing protein